MTRRLLVKEQMRLSGGTVAFDKCEADHIVGLYYMLVRLWQILFDPHGAGLSAGDVIELGIDGLGTQRQTALASSYS